MPKRVFAIHPFLQSSSRIAGYRSKPAAALWIDTLLLIAAGGLVVVATTLPGPPWRVPGHSILQVVLPVCLGMAVVPRYGSGTVIALSALTFGVMGRLLDLTGTGMGLGSLTSLTFFGPILDGALRRATVVGWRQYTWFAVAGMTTNLLALGVRGMAKATGWEHLGGRPLAVWLPQACITYPLCGLLAGLIGGVLLFRWMPRDRSGDDV